MLMAEHREIKRIPNAIKGGRAVINDIPSNFKLGKGHVKFFYNKLFYLFIRYCLIHNECKRRGFNVTKYHDAWEGLDQDLYNCWQPTISDTKLIVNRILNERNSYFL